jgi:hypothetical protein
MPFSGLWVIITNISVKLVDTGIGSRASQVHG